jgi:hypothetical protein
MTDSVYFIGQAMYRFRDAPTGAYYAGEGGPGFGEDHPGNLEIIRDDFKVVKITPKGAWVLPYHFGPFESFEDVKFSAKFILTGKGKRFCYPDMNDAWQSFVIRKQRRAMYLRRQLKYAELALSAALRIEPPEPTPLSASRGLQ